jgi:hypothetical protein
VLDLTILENAHPHSGKGASAICCGAKCRFWRPTALDIAAQAIVGSQGNCGSDLRALGILKMTPNGDIGKPQSSPCCADSRYFQYASVTRRDALS